MRNRASRRTLVRWNDDHDKELLLWMNYCCTEQGIKVPWARIAQCMGASFTEGACIQHLAKIRTKMEEAGLHVPPVQKRGTITKTGSSIYRPKLKEITAPVPRIRPDVPPPGSGGYFLEDSDDDEEEEEDETLVSPVVGKGSRTGRGSVRRQASLLKSTTVKEDSEMEDDEPNLYDSDKEYGAKKATPSPNHAATEKTSSARLQMRLNFGGKQPASHIGTSQSDMDCHNDQPSTRVMQWSQSSPAIKFETISNESETEPSKQAISLPHGIRRKNFAMMDNEDEDEDYAPASEGRAKNKKPRTSRTYTRKTKENKKDAADARVDSVEMSSYQASDFVDNDRLRMPPPSRPASTNSHVGWNNSFMKQPFATSDSYHSSYDTNHDSQDNIAGTVNKFSAAQTHSQNNFPFDQNSVSIPNFNPYAQPANNFDYHSGGMGTAYSGPATRNHSYASTASTSSNDAQPLAWKHPYRSPGFPNPREATAVLHQMLNAEDPGMSADLNAYQTPMDLQSLDGADNYRALGEFTLPQVTQVNELTNMDPEGMFVGQPESEGFCFEEYLNF